MCRLSLRTPPIAPTSVTSSPSRTQVIPRPITFSQCQRLQGKRSRRSGMQVVICSAKKVSKCPEKGRVMEMPQVSSALPEDQENLNVHYRLPLQGLLLGGDQLAWPNYLQILSHLETGPKTSIWHAPIRYDHFSMTLNWRVCSRARLSRDARFDGKFFIGVRTSGVYCRPICPARTAKESNVRYFPSAAAAAEAGFRPCLRCRPECSPGTPAWLGTPNTVARALRLISESGLEAGGIEGLAERLGVGSRHLRRLFIQHLGAAPSAVAQTRRLHFAKKLIDETRLPLGEVALASGFGCVRRFNAAIRNTFKRTPTQIRRLARQTEVQPENEYVFHLRFRPPYHWNGMLSFLAARATPGVELVDQNSYRRSIFLNGYQGHFEVSPNEDRHSLVVRVQIA